jgi:hypothetical protein
MFKRILILAAVGASISGLTGCASIVSGTNQSVSVNTVPVQGATCSLKNNKGIWYVPSTPGSAVVHRSFDNLLVTCRKPGYETGLKSVKSSTKGMAFGNVVFGGVIGAGVDVADGAAYDYPVNILVPMTEHSEAKHTIVKHTVVQHTVAKTVIVKKPVVKQHS